MNKEVSVLVDTGSADNPIIVSTQVWRDKLSVDIRHHWTPEGERSSKPTKKGVRFDPDLLDDIIGALEEIRSILDGEQS